MKRLILSIFLAFITGAYLDRFWVSIFYTLSSCLIELLLFVLPIMVFSFLFRALLGRREGSFLLLLVLFIGVFVSNFTALLTSYLFGVTVLPFFSVTQSVDFQSTGYSEVVMLYKLGLPHLVGTELAMCLAIAISLIVRLFSEKSTFRLYSESVSQVLAQGVTFFLQKFFIPLLPIYLFGFCAKLSYDGSLGYLFQQFGKVFLLSMGLVIAYLIVLYFLGSGGSFKTCKKQIQAMLPAGLTGFSTMSSAATIPVTLACAEVTTQDKHFANLIIPATANIHMLGDDLTIVMTALTLQSSLGIAWPELSSFLIFACAFSFALLSCVGAPGATILVVLPVLQHHLAFTPEMLSIMTTIYILQDCFGTAANVMGNGAFALIVQRLDMASRHYRNRIIRDI